MHWGIVVLGMIMIYNKSYHITQQQNKHILDTRMSKRVHRFRRASCQDYMSSKNEKDIWLSYSFMKWSTSFISHPDNQTTRCINLIESYNNVSTYLYTYDILTTAFWNRVAIFTNRGSSFTAHLHCLIVVSKSRSCFSLLPIW